MKERQMRLLPERRKQFDAFYKHHKAPVDRMLGEVGFAIEDFDRKNRGLEPVLGERTLTHYLDEFLDGLKMFAEAGFKPHETGLWVQAVFEVIKRNSQVIDVTGKDL